MERRRDGERVSAARGPAWLQASGECSAGRSSAISARRRLAGRSIGQANRCVTRRWVGRKGAGAGSYKDVVASPVRTRQGSFPFPQVQQHAHTPWHSASASTSVVMAPTGSSSSRTAVRRFAVLFLLSISSALELGFASSEARTTTGVGAQKGVPAFARTVSAARCFPWYVPARNLHREKRHLDVVA